MPPQLLKTTTFPDMPIDDVLNVLAEPILKMIIIGQHAAFVAKADQLAQDPPIIDRKVIWLKQFPDSLKHHFVNIPDLNIIIGFSSSTINKVSRVIKIGEPEDYAILLAAYNDAGLPQNNQ